MREIHGGDIYRNRVTIDFSVNVNPFGTPEAVKEALYNAAESCGSYPDIAAAELKNAVSRMLRVPAGQLLFGNGASELFMAIVHGIRPKKTLIPVPSFYGYEYAAGAAESEIIYYEAREAECFCLTEDFLEALTEEVDLLFLANPNNPTGNLMSREYLVRLLCHCRERGIFVVLDECFIEFCEGAPSMLSELKTFPNLILVRAFTKIYAIPGVRLGYLVCSNRSLLKKIGRQLPEWNLSGFAQSAGCICATQIGFINKTADYIKKERKFLEVGFKRLGIKVYPGEANFMLLYSEKRLYEELLKEKILIRDCENFRGLTKGFYRIAVKSGAENEILLKTIGGIV